MSPRGLAEAKIPIPAYLSDKPAVPDEGRTGQVSRVAAIQTIRLAVGNL